jgi:hypothetical protein
MTATDDVMPADVATTKCVVVGGGPAGVMLSYLLARAGVLVMLLESHRDFDRDFRGDTVHPSTLEALDSLGLTEKLHALPHSIDSDPEGLQLHAGRNFFQLFSLLFFAVAGAVMGWFATDDRPDIAALIGGILGMIVGTFLSGFILMRVPAPGATTTVSEFRRLHQKLRRRLIVALVAFCACTIGLSFTVPLANADDWTSALPFVDLGLFVGLCCYARMLAHRIRERSARHVKSRTAGLAHVAVAADCRSTRLPFRLYKHQGALLRANPCK